MKKMLKITVRAFAAAVILGVQSAFARRLNSACSASAVLDAVVQLSAQKYSEFNCAHTEKCFGNL